VTKQDELAMSEPTLQAELAHANGRASPRQPYKNHCAPASGAPRLLIRQTESYVVVVAVTGGVTNGDVVVVVVTGGVTGAALLLLLLDRIKMPNPMTTPAPTSQSSGVLSSSLP
jgi:hypothetical protein